MRQRKQQALLAAIIFIVVMCARFVPGISSQSTTATQPKEPTTVTATPHEAEQLASAVADAPLLHRTGYVCCYNAETRLPHWVAWVLTANHTTGPYKRNGIKFQEDTDVDAPRATHEDYIRSGYDRGHLCPSGDNKWSEEAQRQSFLMTNICPQTHNLNAGDWNEMEQQCRRWAEEYGTLYIVCGPILYRQKHKTIGRNKVVVPEAFFKVVLRLQPQPQAIGFIYKNADGNRPKGDYVNTVNEVERITGIDFFPFLDDSIEEQVEDNSRLDQWGL